MWRPHTVKGENPNNTFKEIAPATPEKVEKNKGSIKNARGAIDFLILPHLKCRAQKF
jgi:hypothetical protein